MSAKSEKNLKSVLEILSYGESLTKDELEKRSGVSRFGVTQALKKLVRDQTVVMTRPSRTNLYQIEKDYFHIGTLEVYHVDKYSFYEFKSFNLHGEVVYKDFIENMEESLDALLDHIGEFLKHDSLITCFGISVPAPCYKGTVYPGAISYLDNIDLKKLLETRFPLKVAIQNDANTAVIGYIAHQPEINDAVLLYQPNNVDIGVGIIINKKLYLGRNGMTGELKMLHDQTMGNAVTSLKSTLQRVILLLNPEKVIVHSLILDHLEFVRHLDNVPEIMQPDVEIIKNIGQLFDWGLMKLAIEALYEDKEAN